MRARSRDACSSRKRICIASSPADPFGGTSARRNVNELPLDFGVNFGLNSPSNRRETIPEGGSVKDRKLMIGAVVALAALIALAVAATGAAKRTSAKAGFSAALVSDIIGFNDAGFNRNQLKGLNEAVKKVGGTAIPEV